jgi:hypothetical protein
MRLSVVAAPVALALVLASGAGLGSGRSLPSAEPADLVQEECTGCHAAILADTTSFEELTFPHAPHASVESGCLQCHGEHGPDGARAGVEVVKEDCRTCHHGPARAGALVCESCHGAIYGNSVLFQGRPFNHSVHVGAFTGLECVDCHGEDTEEVVASPPMSSCIGCHP